MSNLTERVSVYQGSDVYMTAKMVDVDLNGQVGQESGIARFLAPFDCRVKWVGVTVEGGSNNSNTYRVTDAAGTGTANDLPAAGVRSDVEGFARTISRMDSGAEFAKGAVIEVQSNGSSTTGAFGYISIIVEPLNLSDREGNDIWITGEVPDGASNFAINIPVPFNCEIIEFGVGIGEDTTGTWNAVINKHPGPDLAGVASVNAGSAGDSSIVDVRNTAAFAPNRFLDTSNYLALSATGVGTAAGKHPYLIRLRVL